MKTRRTSACIGIGIVLLIGAILFGCGESRLLPTRLILVADDDNNRVLIYNYPLAIGQSGNVVLGQPDFVTNSGGTSATKMSAPEAAAVDAAGNVWVTDFYNHRVLQFKPPFTNGMAASLVLGQADFVSSTANTSQNGFNGPDGTAMDGSGNLWVADLANNRVLQFKPPFSNNMNASLVIGQADFTTSTGGLSTTKLGGPRTIAFDPSGNLWVADTGNNRVLEFKPPFSTGMAASTVLGQADFVSAAAPSPPTASSVNGPWGVAADATGNVWVGDTSNNRALQFKPPFSNGMAASLVLGHADFVTSTTATPPTSASSGLPVGMAFDSFGRALVADCGNNRTLVYAPPFSNGMAASIVVGQPDFTSSAAPSPPTAASAYCPIGVTPSF